jgi:isoprenylcysteine carboxyl methyltransferase (ICMT) family protein YpbQ
MIIPLLYILRSWLDFAKYNLPHEVVYLGIASMPFSILLFFHFHKDLGKNWSPSLEVLEEHTLITSRV